MKKVHELNLSKNVRYTNAHEWARAEKDKVRVGLSDYALDQLGDIVFVDLPRIGDAFKQGEAFGIVDSVKAVAKIFMPITGEVAGINTALEESPGLVNQSPYNGGWMIDIKPNDLEDPDRLMVFDAYLEFLRGIE